LSPPIVITGKAGSVPDCTDDPVTTGLDVAPNPFPASTIVSPGLAGVVRPGNKNAARFLPGLKDVELENVTIGHRVLPVDDYPIVRFAEKCPNLYIAAMHSGITLSPLIGQVAAAEILDGVAVDLLNAYRPARFS
jgi:glycine/D-amino acid oxidase-like deaminating enzyme